MNLGNTTVHLHWTKTVDLDLMVLCRRKDGSVELLSFANEGSLSGEPYVQLLSDFEFSEVPKDNQEIVRMLTDQENVAEELWFLTWDFDCVQEGKTAQFSEYGLFLEARQDSDRWSSNPITEPLAETGNLLCIGHWCRGIISTEHSGMSALNRVVMIPMLEGMEEVQAFIQDWVASF